MSSYGPPPGYGQPGQPQPGGGYGSQTPGYGPPPGYAQPQYGPPPGQPPYGQPPYGQPQYGQPYAPGHYGAPAGQGSESFGIVGAAIGAVGVVLLIVAFTAANWYHFDGGGESHFSRVRESLDLLHSESVSNGLSYAYFHWLAWVLLAICVAGVVGATIVTPVATAMRFVGGALGLAAVVLTLFSVQLVSGGVPADSGVPDGLGDYLKHASIAFYLALAGFVLLGVGSLLGTTKSRQR